MKYDLSYYIEKYRRRAVVALVVIVTLIVGLVVYQQIRTAMERSGTIAVPVEVVPRDAQVTLSNGDELPSRGTAYIAPGDYKITVKKEGFASQTRELRVSSAAVPYIYIGLTGKSDQAKSWQKSHLRDYQNLELLTIAKNRDYTTLFRSANPIVEILPIKDPYYTIDYRNHDDTSIELIIYGTSPRYRTVALEFLRDKGYEPTDYRITYEGFDNPLKKDKEENDDE